MTRTRKPVGMPGTDSPVLLGRWVGAWAEQRDEALDEVVQDLDIEPPVALGLAAADDWWTEFYRAAEGRELVDVDGLGQVEVRCWAQNAGLVDDDEEGLSSR